VRRWIAIAAVAPWAAWAIGRTLGLDRVHPLIAVVAFTPYAAVTAPIPVLVALALRRRAAAVVALVAAVLAAVLGQVQVEVTGLAVSPGVGFLLVVGQGVLVVATVLGAQPLASAGLPRVRSWRVALIPLTLLALLLPVGGLVWFLGFCEPALDEERDSGIPAYMVVSSEAGPEHGILVVRGSVEEGLSYSVRRGDGVTLGEDEVLALTDEDAAFTSTVRALAARPDPETAEELARHGIEYVVLPEPADPDVAASVDATIGLVAASAENRSTRAWQVDRPAARDAVDGPRSWLHLALVLVELVAVLVVAVLCAPTSDRGRR